MVVKSYELESTVARLKKLEKTICETHNPLEERDVVKSVKEYANTIYNQALDDFVKALKDESSKEWEQFDNWYEFADYIKNKLMK